MSSVIGPTAAAPQLQMRAFGDVAATRQNIFDNAIKAAQSFKPVTNTRHALELSDVGWTGPARFTRREHKQAILENRSLDRRMLGTWTLKDNVTGDVLDKRRQTIAHVPYLMDSGAFVRNGTEYQLAHQQRLRPGIYTRIQDNGELEAHVNPRAGTGHANRIYLDPESGVFRMKLEQAQIPLMPLLRALGATDTQLREHWGNELTAINMQRDDPATLNKFYKRLLHATDQELNDEGRKAALQNVFSKMSFDGDVMKRTLGKDYTSHGLDTLLATTGKLLRVFKGAEHPDDRDHQAYQQLLGPEDVIAERFAKNGSEVRRALWKASAQGSLRKMKSGIFTPSVHAALLSTGLGQAMEEINPLEILDQQTRVTRMGESGIPSLDSVPEEARAVHHSQLGFIDLVRTPESAKTGVELRFSRAARKGNDGKLYAPFRDIKTGQMTWKTAADIVDSTVAFPGEMSSNSAMVDAIQNNRVRMVPRGKVDFEMPPMEDTFNQLTNLVPFKSMMKGHRASMASRMITQALPLVNRQSPLVQAAMPENHGKSFDEEYSSHVGVIRADRPSRVVSVSADEIVLKDKDGNPQTIELYNNQPFSRKTMLHNTPVVRPGDTIQPGQLLAKSNLSDDNGSVAIGLNARVAYLPMKGANYEDATVISESMAERMRSEHMYQHQLELAEKVKPSKNAYATIFPGNLTKKQLDNYDDSGVIKPGTQVEEGDPLILAVEEREAARNRLHSGRKSNFDDASVAWHHSNPGIVTDVAMTPKGISVIVKSTEAMRVGDKMAGRHGDKGVVAAIIPDDNMPQDSQGRPFEVLVNPLGIISRSNPSQIVESALGKIAEKTGKPIKVPDFNNMEDMVEWAIQECQKNGVEDTETVYDPESTRRIQGVLAGNRFFMKLHHTAESKAAARSFGGYTTDNSPAKGGPTGSKKIGMLELGALLSHGATAVVRDAHLVRGQGNPDYWQQYLSGNKPSTPDVPQVYHKFVNFLKGSGINVVRDGTMSHIMALTDKDVDQMAEGRELKSADTVHWDDKLKPVEGGLFDEKLTGGHAGNKWSTFKLHEPMPSPVMEEPIRRVLGLTENQFLDVLGGKEEFRGHRGPSAISKALQQLDLTKEIAKARAEVASGKKTARDAAVRRLKYLVSAERLGLHPGDWVLSKVPVLPPLFRPVSTMGHKRLPLVADPNYLYAELFDANKSLAEMSKQVDDVADERLAVYNAFKAVTGLGDPVHPKNRERHVRGLLSHVFGNSPKTGMVQQRLLGVSTDLVGRAVITPNPDLDMDHVGLPEEKAWEIFKPFVIRNLVKKGHPRLAAARSVEERSSAARTALLAEMASRPVIVNRAPTLHRYGMMAFRAQLAKGDTLQVSPIITGGFGADFDGDAMQFHVPASDDAVEEAYEKMMPSRNLLAASTFKPQYKPSHEYQGGLWAASAVTDKTKRPQIYRTQADAVRAYRRGEIGVGQEVHILED